MCKSDIFVYPEDIWDYITMHRAQLERAIVIVAENVFDEVELALEVDGKTPVLSVYVNDKELEREYLVSRQLAEKYARELYDAYLAGYDDGVSDTDSAETQSPDDQEYLDMEIDQREEELYNAFTEFLDVVLGDSFPMLKLVDEDAMLDEILSLISSLGLEVYRPCFLDTGDGTQVFVEYPYSETTPEEPGGNIN